MDYGAHYDRLMERARGRVLAGYRERHHVLPRCLGGIDDEVVELTPEEHYVAHLLLVKMHPGDTRLVWAAMCMTGAPSQMQRRNKAYGWLRREFAIRIGRQRVGVIASEETRARQRAAKLGKRRAPHSQATKDKMRAAAAGKPKSVKHRAALAQAKLGNKNRLGGKSYVNVSEV